MPAVAIANGRILQSTLTPLPANVLRGKTPTLENWGYTAIGYAFLDDGGVFTDDTTDANSAAANDVPLMPAVEAINDAFYFGGSLRGGIVPNLFQEIKINIGTAGVGNTIAWEYYNGSAWASLTVTDGTNGFTTLGTNTVTFTPPTDWATVAVNAVTTYWVRARVTAAAFTTIPLATQIWLMVKPDQLALCVDGATGTSGQPGTVKLTASSTNLGSYVFRQGKAPTPNPIMVSARIMWQVLSAGNPNLTCYIESSPDDITWNQNDNSVAYYLAAPALTEVKVDTMFVLIYDDYFRIRFGCNAANTVEVTVIEVVGYEVGK